MRKYLQVGWLLTDYEGLISWVGIWGWAYSFPWNLHDTGVLWFQVSISCSHSSISFMAGKVLASVFAQVSSPFHWWPCFFFVDRCMSRANPTTTMCKSTSHSMCRKRRCRRPVAGSVTTSNQFDSQIILKAGDDGKPTKKRYKKTIENGKNYIVGLVLEQWRDPLRIFWVITGVRNELVLTPNVPIRHHGPL